MISIVFGTYNRLFRLKKLINSIIASDNISIIRPEIIILDGGSNDGTIEYIKKYIGKYDIKLIQEGYLHGVTRTYNKGFRLASKQFLTWISDDFEYCPNTLKHIVDRLPNISNESLLSFVVDSGSGFKEYGKYAVVGAAHRTLFKKLDYWSEEYISYASDSDFSIRVHMIGGSVITDHEAKVKHNIDRDDEIHRKNILENTSTARFKKIYNNFDICQSKNKSSYINIWVNASSAEELINKIENHKIKCCWGNYYTKIGYNIIPLLQSMNVQISSFMGADYYQFII